MTAKYQLFKNPRSLLKENREYTLYPRIVRSRKVTMEEISKNIADRSTFTTADVLGVWTAIESEILWQLKDGNQIELDGLGHFSVILKCRDITDPKEIRAESIQFSKVSFLPAKKLHEKLKGMPVERDESRAPLPVASPEERQQRILSFLRENREITSSVCMRLNACSRHTAQKDLKWLAESGQILCYGGPNVSIYLLNPDML
ncbi:MAG: HU family DNA-binding protein [Tannerellaceae bacterium]|nr:HU family DNA-binding protein [Tannerellaceae bacterium]